MSDGLFIWLARKLFARVSSPQLSTSPHEIDIEDIDRRLDHAERAAQQARLELLELQANPRGISRPLEGNDARS